MVLLFRSGQHKHPPIKSQDMQEVDLPNNGTLNSNLLFLNKFYLYKLRFGHLPSVTIVAVRTKSKGD